MRLPLLATAIFFALTCGGIARAEHQPSDAAKPLEPSVRPAKKTLIFASPLFVEQKETPGASKTALHLSAQRQLSDKSKD